jgi:hypothetical protein
MYYTHYVLTAVHLRMNETGNDSAFLHDLADVFDLKMNKPYRTRSNHEI